MKRTFTLFFMALILYNSVGFIATMRYARHEWRVSMRKKLADGVGKESLSVFKFNKNTFDKKTHEFQYNGRWYDVVRLENEGDTIVVFAYDDATETQLTAQYHNILIKNNAEDNDFQSKTKHIFNNLIKEFIFKNPVKKMTPSVETAFIRPFYYYHFFLINPFLDIDSPPPNGILI